MVQDTLEQRAATRRAKGKSADGLSISPVEPEAVVQPQKDKKTFASSYKPSILANDARIIVACDIDPASELTPMPNLLDQAEDCGQVETILLDAGYHAEAVITETEERGIELLCPEGRTHTDGDWKRQAKKKYPKSHFTYHPTSDTYRCPAGEQRQPGERYQGTALKEGYVRYGTSACGACGHRSRCTTSPQGRKLKRYRSDEIKAVLREAMTDPDNQQRYRQRQAMVEPVFSVLRLKQGLNRFRRRGLPGVKREWALHVMAYNLGRSLILSLGWAFFRLLGRLFHRLRRWWPAQTVLPDGRPCSTNPAPRPSEAVLGGNADRAEGF